MPKTTLGGHPLHPQLIGIPVGLAPFSLTMDILGQVTGKRAFTDAGRYALWGALGGAVVAGASALGDYLDIQPRTATKRTANTHAILNLSIIGLLGTELALRRKDARIGPLPLALSVVSNVGLFISAWYGGDMVYTHGMRVEKVSPIADAPELALPFDSKIEDAMVGMMSIVPESGPSTALANDQADQQAAKQGQSTEQPAGAGAS